MATSWTPDRVALLGTMPDAALARQLGLSTGAVLQARRSRGIPAYSPAAAGVWVPLDPAPLSAGALRFMPGSHATEHYFTQLHHYHWNHAT